MMSKNTFQDVFLASIILALVGFILVVAIVRDEPDPSPEAATYTAPEQDWIRTGPERAFLSDLTELGVFSDESTLLAVGEVWCTGKRAGQGTEEVIDRMRHLTLLASLDPREVKPIAGAATLRLCPEQGAALDAHYGEK